MKNKIILKEKDGVYQKVKDTNIPFSFPQNIEEYNRVERQRNEERIRIINLKIK
jgi:hypothetical protein